MKIQELKILLSGHYILNTLSCCLYPVLKSFQPFCTWLFPNDECEMEWKDLELLCFLAVVLAVKNRKLKPASWQEFMSMLFMLCKISNFVLFVRQDIRLGVLYLVICLILFLIFPEPAYKGPDNVRYFRGPGLDEELLHNPNVTWIVEFYGPWSPQCVRLAPIFANLSLKYSCEFLKFGKIDAGKYPVVAKRHRIDSSVLSKQVPSILVYEGGKETKRRPTVNIKSVVAPYSFTEEKILRDFDIEELYQNAKEKERNWKKANKNKEEKKDK
ncbi:thioredoxin-related transmembrane protein 2-B-like [Actinia tenebrosa]|uniref:Thioredoxin-related transmembrane protein 2-B-like n=1 Tax=Actinia tenebrosa TaxID=6105 RepID=A0A6P8HVC9_ACTTE|nr:thioredoxin-related transmembrane protein 2-B-like [Actinia tenebrosa]XP_031559331.1 thioredoxin-related transmembrane protein 2-B-like [Actinia tenebrosa]